MSRLALVCLIACVIAGPARAQADAESIRMSSDVMSTVNADSGTVNFLARARASTARYRDREEAIFDGYRPIGDDFPGMGEHWIQIGRIFSRRVDAAHPAVLEYATIEGRPTLVGVAYALALLDGESAPEFPAPHLWHQHTGTVAEETDLLTQVMTAHSEMHGARLVMLHAWIWLPNPAGIFASDNWALPFVRAGVPVPRADPGAVAGRAISLVSGGDVFYAGVFEDMAGATGRDSIAIHDALASAQTRAAEWAVRHRDRSANPAALDSLRGIWQAMWSDLDASLGAVARERLRPVDGRRRHVKGGQNLKHPFLAFPSVFTGVNGVRVD